MVLNHVIQGADVIKRMYLDPVFCSLEESAKDCVQLVEKAFKKRKQPVHKIHRGVPIKDFPQNTRECAQNVNQDTCVNLLRPCSVKIQQSISSMLIARVIQWRNAHGKEEHWQKDGTRPFLHVIGAQIALPILALTGIIDSIAYMSFALLTKVSTGKASELSLRLLESSSFTILWSIIVGILPNVTMINLHTYEPLARQWIFQYVPSCLRVYRAQDRLFCRNWYIKNSDNTRDSEEYKRLDSVIDVNMHDIEQGANILCEFAEQDNDSKDALCDCGDEGFRFLLNKTIWAYVFGPKCCAPILDIFKLQTWVAIYEMRKNVACMEKQKKERVSQILENAFSTFTAYKNAQKQIPKLLSQISQVGIYELQSGEFLTQCGSRATQKLRL